MSSVAVYGSVNWDEICSLERYPRDHEKLEADSIQSALGGSAANTATWLAAGLAATEALAPGSWQVELIGAVGDDVEGRRCRDWLRACGVGLDAVEVLDGAATSRACAWVVGSEKRIVTHRQLRLLRERAPADAVARAAAARHLHIGSLVDGAALECLTAAAGADSSISVELSSKRQDAARERADIVFLNTAELRTLFGISAASLSTGQLALVAPKPGAMLVVTDGAHEIICLTRERLHRFPVTPLDPVRDRTGGGDAFDGGFLAAWVTGADLDTAVERGLTTARAALMQVGGARQPSLPYPTAGLT